MSDDILARTDRAIQAAIQTQRETAVVREEAHLAVERLKLKLTFRVVADREAPPELDAREA